MNTYNATIKIDDENNAEAWWTAARKRTDCPKILRPLLRGRATEVETASPEEANAALAWCEQIEGWADGPEYARQALLLQVS